MWPAEAGWWALFLFLWMVTNATASRPCIPKYFRKNAMVCVCNATYCDTMDPVLLPPVGHYLKYETTKAGQRLEPSTGKFGLNRTQSGSRYTYNPFVQYQHIKGFGGSNTDAAAIIIMQLSPAAQKHLLRSYFSEEGIEYNLLRFPMACSDFSTRPYSYADDCPYDYELNCFRLVQEDLEFRIPLFHHIRALSVRPLSLVASPWTSPGWLKVSDKVMGKARLKGKAGDKFHKTWANYFIRFLDEYERHKIRFWAITSQNEPSFGQWLPMENFPNIIYSAEEQRDFISQDLGPTLTASRHRDVLLLMLDDQRSKVLDWAKVVLGNSSAAQYVAGIAVHWYTDDLTVPGLTLDPTRELYPNYFLIYTEAANGYRPWERKVVLGSWERGISYSHNIATNLNSYVTGWIDWNLALDMQGGPNYVRNFVDSPIIVNTHKDEFYKQPMFYHLAHFSKFILEGSVRVSLTSDKPLGDCRLVTTAFLRPDCVSVLVVINRCVGKVAFSISDDGLGFLEDISPANSIQTYLWRRPRC
ncbi:hypothetical protein lerEdw1_014762 [Lerista edwardsae]|nr:hypothetical protein lerEdw1_014763 [Lerista edwardsae]KAJ6626113.1 hypothetical protein lerEdw1_014762 [Lerista edwardsae]